MKLDPSNIASLFGGLGDFIKKATDLTEESVKVSSPKWCSLKNGAKVNLTGALIKSPYKKYFWSRLKTKITYHNGHEVVVDCSPHEINL